jgi:hypothetical protein
MPLLLLDEVIIGAKFAQYVCCGYRASVSFVAKMYELLIFGTIAETKREQRVGLDRQPFALPGT